MSLPPHQNATGVSPWMNDQNLEGNCPKATDVSPWCGGLREKTKEYLKEHYLAILAAVLVGFIYLAPHLFFIVSLGDKYQGIPMIQTANEEFYLGRMQEIIDGHPLVGSFAFYEYKDQNPLSPPLGEFLYVLPTLFLGVDLLHTDIASKFILPLILFLLVYFLVYNLLEGGGALARKINSIAASLLILLGYDLVDYRSLWSFLTGKVVYGGSFLLWARPVNPIIGGIFLFAFLLTILLIIKRGRATKLMIVGAAAFFAMMVMNYVFCWGLALAIWVVLVLFYLLRKNYQLVKSLFWMMAVALVFTLPYWYMSWQSSHSPWYRSSILRSGLFYTHYPILNKVVLITLFFYFILYTPLFFRKLKNIIKNKAPFLAQFNLSGLADWQLFCLALLLGGLIAYNQQIITGMTIWPFHFVQFTISLALVVICVLLFNVIKRWRHSLWLGAVFMIIAASLVFGPMVQIKTYKKNYDYYVGLQPYKPVFDWLNSQKKDCVVLDKVDKRTIYGYYNWGGYILAFSHCNTYANNWSFSLMPDDRLYHNYLVHLRLEGVTPDSLQKYLKESGGEYRSYLFSNWKGLFDVDGFPDFSDKPLEERIKKVPQDFAQFYANDFREELNKYRLDYIFSVGPLEQNILSQLPGLKVAFSSNNVYLYDFNK